MKGLPIQKIIDLLKSLKGKSKKVAIITVGLFVIGALGIQFGIVGADILDNQAVIDVLNSLSTFEFLDKAAEPVVIDSISKPVVDTLIK
jgi:hypothetical protein